MSRTATEIQMRIAEQMPEMEASAAAIKQSIAARIMEFQTAQRHYVTLHARLGAHMPAGSDSRWVLEILHRPVSNARYVRVTVDVRMAPSYPFSVEDALANSLRHVAMRSSDDVIEFEEEIEGFPSETLIAQMLILLV